MAAEHIHYLNDDNFDEGVKEGVVLVDFYADWCGPCRMLNPIIEELAAEMVGKAKVVKVDTDQAVNVASKFEVTSIPTLLLLKNGEVLERVVGLKDLDALRAMIQKAL